MARLQIALSIVDGLRVRKSALISVALLATLLTMPVIHAQTFSILHTFTGGQDGGNPFGALAIDHSGNLYGVATYGGNTSCPEVGGYYRGCGVIFKMKRSGSGWLFQPLYLFSGGDGANPSGGVTVAPDGTLYGTTNAGGGGSCPQVWGNSGCGTVFHLRPSPTRCLAVSCRWTDTELYQFTGGSDGGGPWGGVALDQAGNVYGTTYEGGSGYGVAYAITPSQSGWTESVIHTFTGGSDGGDPASNPISDSNGNLYGTTLCGGSSGSNCAGYGTVFELTRSGSDWNESVLYAFPTNGDTALPQAGLTSDSAGNLYGTTEGGLNTVYELSPGSGAWTFTSLYEISFGGLDAFRSPVTMDSAGNLYGVTEFGGGGGGGECPYGCGTVFKLSPSAGGWTYTTLHEFDYSDGFEPYGGVVVDGNGVVYGTASAGGGGNCQLGCGVVWQIAPEEN